MLAHALAKGNNPSLAAEAARKAEALGGTNPQLLRALANFYAGLVPDLPKAAELGEKYAAKAPGDKTAWRRVAALYLQLGRPEQAIAAGNRGVPVDNSVELHTLLGSAHASRKDWAAAATEFESAIRLDPHDEEAHFRLAQLYLFKQDFPKAVGVLEGAKKVFDKSPRIELALGVAYYGQRRFDKAVGQFLRTMQLAPEVPQPYVFLGRILEHASGSLPEITEHFADFERRKPSSDLAYMLHAKALIAQLPTGGFPPEAEQAFALLEKAIAINEGSAETNYLMGTLLERKRDFDGAAQHLERSVQLNGGDSAVHFHLARVYNRLGRREDAQRERGPARKAERNGEGCTFGWAGEVNHLFDWPAAISSVPKASRH
jgi:tetratricopeptide (TPR) repeat protein